MPTTRLALRPKDPLVTGLTRTYMDIPSHEAVRRLLDLVYRDCRDACDLTHGAGNFWRDPPPPGLTLYTNNYQAPSGSTYSVDAPPQAGRPARYAVDFTDTGWPDGLFDLAIFDPPHVADAGQGGIMGARYGSIRTQAALEDLLVRGLREARRIARLGLLLKVTDASHGGRLRLLSHLALDTLDDLPPYAVLHTTRPDFLRDGKHKAVRAPRSNGAVYLAWRLDSPDHFTWREAPSPAT